MKLIYEKKPEVEYLLALSLSVKEGFNEEPTLF
jgi:hypothetical protein